MEPINKILIAVDFSDQSRDTLRYGLTLAWSLKAVVVVVNVLNQRDVDAVKYVEQSTGQLSAAAFVQAQQKERAQRLADLVKEADCPGPKVATLVRVGVPWEEIVKTIGEEGVDLVIAGTKGRTNLSRTLFGSTAEKIHRHSPVSVLSARGKAHADLLCRLRPEEG